MSVPADTGTAAPIEGGTIGKVTGIGHLFAALRYSLGGAVRLYQETAFRHEIVGCVMIFSVFAAIGVAPRDYVVMAVLLLGLAAAEALNTAVEEIVDKISPEWSSTGLHAKNLGSFAVFCLLAANGLMASFIIVSRLFAP